MSKIVHFGVEVDDVSSFIENEKEFYSQAHQDLFVLGINKYIDNGTWVDIGCSCPREHSNTLLLESVGWSGLNLDIRDYKDLWSAHRKNTFTHCDATKINYLELFKNTFKTNTINYLSLDVDTVSNIVLQKIPFNEYTFNVITIEHDLYAGQSPYRQKGYTNDVILEDDPYNIKQEQHRILSKNGYVCLAENVFVYQKQITCPFEDWWVSENIFNDLKIKFQNTFSDEILNRLGFVSNRNCILQNKAQYTKSLKSYATECVDIDNPQLTIKNQPGIIFVKDDWINLFSTKVLPSINYPFILLTDKVDETNTALLDCKTLLAWFTINSSIKHSKILELSKSDPIEDYKLRVAKLLN